MESELFGHEKGVFTGATESRSGKFEQAQGGTMLLDEVSEMDPALQAKLLRVLQEREVERVGGRKAIPLDVRVVATTNRDLPSAVRNGSFREDLYYRLHVIPIRLPPLRERPADVLPLARHFLALACRSHGRPAPRLNLETEQIFAGYSWPGNVRELQNAMERVAILARGEEVEPGQLFLEGELGNKACGGVEVTGTLEEMEQRIILAAFEKHDRNKKATARALGINVKTLRARLKAYGIDGLGEGGEDCPPGGEAADS
jgi:two-component system response regulator FlrC